MSCRVRVSAVRLLSVSLLFGAVGLSAQSEPEDLIKYRQNLMRAQAGHLGAMVQIINGGVALGSQLPVHARSLHTLTGFLVNVFPEDSDFGETRAKEEIWEDFDAFSEAARRVRTAAGQLATVAESGSQEELQAKLGAARNRQASVWGFSNASSIGHSGRSSPWQRATRSSSR
jgi:cytochrome c556